MTMREKQVARRLQGSMTSNRGSKPAAISGDIAVRFLRYAANLHQRFQAFWKSVHCPPTLSANTIYCENHSHIYNFCNYFNLYYQFSKHETLIIQINNVTVVGSVAGGHVTSRQQKYEKERKRILTTLALKSKGL